MPLRAVFKRSGRNNLKAWVGVSHKEDFKLGFNFGSDKLKIKIL
ncbi:hypothetical protein LEP1GSC108_1656 [Leptospira weilii str. UI 13098]|uniref:Uncharacterized protein n=1 Tax=Leptospira weilii str. UI 13098 TaxID=1088542 RepID=M6QSK0_9LEPT|nr:hypothetical protein LEP1GSC108_1656 [Leptospira weilii str. UI 13098]